MEIGERLKQLREQKGLSQDQVGDYIGVKGATVHRYETGEIDIKRTIALKLAALYNVSPAHIMGWNGEHEKDSLRAEFDALMTEQNGAYFRLAKGARDRKLELDDDDIEVILNILKKGQKRE
jgi:transcriptional regulator with XRE-family HTH domain